MSKYAAVFEAPTQPGGNWSGYAPDLPGLAVVGDTLEECRQSMASGIEVYLDALRRKGLPVPKPTTRAEEFSVAA